MPRTLLALVLSVPLLFTTVVSATPAHTASNPKSIQRTGVTPGDAQIDATIRAKLAKSKIGKDGFKFHVSHGIVTWEGTTNVIQHKGSATRMAHAAGATGVVNNIQISEAARQKAATNLKKAHVTE